MQEFHELKASGRFTMPDAEIQPGACIAYRDEHLLSGPVLLGLAQAVFAKGMPLRFKTKGFSMLPFIKDGDTITIAPVSGGMPGLGDVAAFVAPDNGRLVVHRVVGKGKEGFLLRGDNATQTDGRVPEENILGRVVRVERNRKETWIGLGRERRLIAFLSRGRLLRTCLSPAWRIMGPILRQWGLWSR